MEGRRSAGLALLALLAALGLASPTNAQGPTPSVKCAFDPASHELTVEARNVETRISRQPRSKQIVVRVKRGDRIGCSGETPTVSTVDTIRADSDEEVGIDLRRGRFGPGFTDEGDGSSEIEMELTFARKGGLRVFGSRRKDLIAIGDQKNGRHGVNLNLREAGRDADISVVGGFNAISVVARRGNDRVKATGGPEFAAPVKARVTISGGKGRDRLTGSEQRDLIGGGKAPDLIRPKGGRDRVRSQGASDLLRLRDGLRDDARCGRGEDRAIADEIDLLEGCEKKRLR